jgi:hypothetical protein
VGRITDVPRPTGALGPVLGVPHWSRVAPRTVAPGRKTRSLRPRQPACGISKPCRYRSPGQMWRSVTPSGILVTQLATPALPRVLPHRRLAGAARLDECGQGCEDPHPATPETRSCAASSRGHDRTDRAVLAAPIRLPPQVRRIGSSSRPPSLAGIGGWPPAVGPTPAGPTGDVEVAKLVERTARDHPAGATGASAVNRATRATTAARSAIRRSGQRWAHHRHVATTPPGGRSGTPRPRPRSRTTSCPQTARSPCRAGTCCP